ncbi:hypothetical protein ANN_01331 [Periplaneta americana]|uniref:Uncharacterized protein n=1 Tax=Periplaneta americana TaxID=6978 RepID=A0ABQ8TTD0_PERAM|nr:hypothetical protein ANN_01331 [Periplaneta americana]
MRITVPPSTMHSGAALESQLYAGKIKANSGGGSGSGGGGGCGCGCGSGAGSGGGGSSTGSSGGGGSGIDSCGCGNSSNSSGGGGGGGSSSSTDSGDYGDSSNTGSGGCGGDSNTGSVGCGVKVVQAVLVLVVVLVQTVVVVVQTGGGGNTNWWYVRKQNTACSVRSVSGSLCAVMWLVVEPREFNVPTLPQRRITYVPEKLPSKYGVHSEEYLPIRTVTPVVAEINVINLVDTFRATECTERKKSVRWPTKVTEDAVEDARERLQRGPNKSFKKLAVEIGVSYCAVSSTQKFLVQQHITTSKHQANKQLNSKQRQLFLTQPTTSNVRSEFNIDVLSSLLIFLSTN